MAQEIYELHSTRTKEMVRIWVREILVLVLICSLVLFFRYRDPYENAGTDLFISIVFGVPLSLIIWAVYRLLRFAIGR